MPIPDSIYLQALKHILRPMVRLCLHGSHTIYDFFELTKIAFVEVANEELSRFTKKVNSSRLSAMTGLNRNEVARILKRKEPPAGEGASIPARVIANWQGDKRFLTSANNPRILRYDGEKSEFAELVESVSTNLHAGTVLFELERLGVVKKEGLNLRLTGGIAKWHENPERAFQLLGKDGESLIAAIEENIFFRRKIPNLHIRTEYDNILLAAVPEIRGWLLEEGAAFHKKVRDYLSRFDRDLNPRSEGEAGVKVSLTSFSLTSDQENS